MRVRVVIPARNEGKSIAETVRAARSLPGVCRVIVVDDASADATAREARKEGAEVITTGRRLGKGGALTLGLDGLMEDVVLFLDGDLGKEVSKASVLLESVIAGVADMSIASVRTTGKGGFGAARGLASWGIRRLTGVSPLNPLSGQRALRREVLEGLRCLARGFGVEVGLTVDAVRLGYRVVEVPTDMVHRGTGRGPRGFCHRAGQFWDILGALMGRGLLRGGFPQ